MDLAPLLPVLFAAATAASPDSAAPRMEIHAVRAEQAINVDGVLDEAVWRSAPAVTRFLQRDPKEGEDATQPTDVRVAFDDEALYVGARCRDSAPDSIVARLTRRDVSIAADRFVVYLDPYHDQRTGYYFMINAAGTMYDGTLFNDTWSDNSWDAVWQGKARVDREGWSCEMRIPFSQLRFQRTAEGIWGINFRRSLQRRNEEDYIVFMPKKESGFVSRFPHLVGLGNVAPARAIEVMPYLTTKAEFLHHAALDPFHDGSRYRPDGGGDLRMALGDRLTLNATANPDFGQVEVDPAVVNLSDVESFFQEKRPFFVEGASKFAFGQEGGNSYWGFNWSDPVFFYSRRVGRSPQRDVGDPDYSDIPVGTSIVGAGKVTGKIAPTWNFGTLHALTASETGRTQNGGVRWDPEVEPLTYYGVTRTQKEFKDRRAGLGFLSTTAIRSFDDDGLRDQLNGQSYVGGLDGWWFLDKNQAWVVSGWSALSHVRGSQARITALQSNSRHYFQRPEATHVELDPDATSLTGFGSRYWLNKQKGNVILNAAAGFMNPKFDVNDVGFMSRADVINAHVGGGYKWTETTKSRKYQDALAAVFANYDFGGNPTSLGVWAQGTTEFINNYSWNYSVAYNPQSVSTTRTRGGPRMIVRPGYEVSTYFDTDGKKKLFYFINLYGYAREAARSWNTSVSPGVEWKPVSNLTLRVGTSWSRSVENAQYVDQYEDATATATYGRRYVFSDLNQTEVSADIHLDWSFAPNLSLQTFVQPLISTADYTGFKSLARSRSDEFTPLDYGDNPDFNVKSLRGNTVLRWEYMPGSTLYLVWTQERSDDSDPPDFEIGRSFNRLFRKSDMDNIFLAKVTYYLTR